MAKYVEASNWQNIGKIVPELKIGPGQFWEEAIHKKRGWQKSLLKLWERMLRYVTETLPGKKVSWRPQKSGSRKKIVNKIWSEGPKN